MKLFLRLAILVFFISLASPLIAQDDVFIEEYLERLENSRKYLIVTAETMPEDNYGFKATSESLSFAENLMHIAWAMDWHSQSLLGGRKARDWNSDTELKVDNKSKEEMIAAVNEIFDKTISFIKGFDVAQLDDELDYFGLKRSKRQILLLLSDHITHHRGHMLVYLRLKGLAPPRYVLFQ